MGSPARVFRGDLRTETACQLRFLFLRGGGVDALVDGGAVLGGEVGVEQAGVFAGDGGHLRGEQTEDQAVLVRRPDLAVAAQKGCAGGLFAHEAERAVDQAIDEPLEAHGHFEHGPAEAFGYAIDDG